MDYKIILEIQMTLIPYYQLPCAFCNYVIHIKVVIITDLGQRQKSA